MISEPSWPGAHSFIAKSIVDHDKWAQTQVIVSFSTHTMNNKTV